MERLFYTYIVTNFTNNVLYTGISANAIYRARQHKDKVNKGFTNKYNANKLVYYEEYSTAKEAILREKQIKGYNRLKKINLIKTINPEFKDLLKEFEID